METIKVETLQDLDSQIAEMEADFQKKKEAVDAMPTVPPESPTDKKQKELLRLKQVGVDKLTEERKEKAKLLLANAKQKKRELNVQIGSLRYPYSTSEDVTFRAVGETQISNALTLLSTSQKHEVILSAMQAAVNVNRIDFASTILDKILATCPEGFLDEVETDMPSEKPNIHAEKGLREFCLAIIEIYDSLGNSEMLKKLNSELKKVVAIETKLKTIISSPMTVKENRIELQEAPSEAPNTYVPDEARTDFVNIQ